MQPCHSRATRLRNRTIQVLSGCVTGQLKHCPVAQPDYSSATRLRNRTTPALPGYASGQSRCATGWHFPRVCASGSLICPVAQPCHCKSYPVTCTQLDNSSIVRLHNRTTKALSGYITGQLKHNPCIYLCILVYTQIKTWVLMTIVSYLLKPGFR